MYFPYFRGKQYELIAIRESVKLLKDSDFIPIIEPVKKELSGLDKALTMLKDGGARAIVIVNPFHGHYSEGGEAIISLISEKYKDYSGISAGILLTNSISVEDVISLIDLLDTQELTLVHSGFTEARALVEKLGESVKSYRHVFHEEHCGKIYQRHFKGAERVLLRDGFHKRTNREHPDEEFFSDLHVTYEDEGMDGFGDYLMVGDGYSESGGPAYAIAIHLTYIDEWNDDEMHIHHFKSIRQDDPKDPAGKFGEALTKMVAEVQKEGSSIFETEAVKEFLGLHERQHFPGLGYVKKLSMKHHLETFSSFFKPE